MSFLLLVGGFRRHDDAWVPYTCRNYRDFLGEKLGQDLEGRRVDSEAAYLAAVAQLRTPAVRASVRSQTPLGWCLPSMVGKKPCTMHNSATTAPGQQLESSKRTSDAGAYSHAQILPLSLICPIAGAQP